MYLQINDNTTLRHIQKKFFNYYPYLRLNFTVSLMINMKPLRIKIQFIPA